MPEENTQSGTKDEALLRRIKERYRYGMQKWQRNRDEGKLNMRYLAGDPWTDKEKQARGAQFANIFP